MFFEISVPENYAIFTGKETPTQVFPVNIAKFLRSAFFVERLWRLLLKRHVSWKLHIMSLFYFICAILMILGCIRLGYCVFVWI